MAKLFKDFGKAEGDLINDDFKYQKVVEVKTNAGNGFSLTNSIVVDGDASLTAKFNDKTNGVEASLKLISSGKQELKLSGNKLGVNGLKVNADTVFEKDNTRSYTAGVAYKAVHFAADAKVTHPETKLTASVAGHHDAFLVGAKVTVSKLENEEGQKALGLAGAEGGVQYQNGDFQAGLKIMQSKKNGVEARVSAHKNLNAATAVAAFVQSNRDSSKFSAAAGVSHQYHANTTVKATLNEKATFQLLIQSQLSSHSKVTACLEGSAKAGSTAPNKVGVKLVLS